MESENQRIDLWNRRFLAGEFRRSDRGRFFELTPVSSARKKSLAERDAIGTIPMHFWPAACRLDPRI